MIRDTSIEAFNAIKENGLLSKRRWQVYEYVFEHGPCTMMQANMNLNKGKYSNGSYTSRFHELRDQGLLKEIGKVKCDFTGRTVLLWDVTSKLPVKFEREKRTKCTQCNGKGYVVEQQARLF